MNNYVLYLSPTKDNKIRYFYLVNKKDELIYMGNTKISDYFDSLKKLENYIEDTNDFLIIPINDEKFKIFFDMRYSYLKDMNYKNFLRTYNLYEWLI